MIKIAATADVYKASEDNGDWIVWASDPNGDGGILVTSFSGPDAEDRALEYAAAKYSALLRHDPDQPPYLSSQLTSGPAARASIRGANLRLVK